jgi:hypothetical protein
MSQIATGKAFSAHFNRCNSVFESGGRVVELHDVLECYPLQEVGVSSVRNCFFKKSEK